MTSTVVLVDALRGARNWVMVAVSHPSLSEVGRSGARSDLAKIDAILASYDRQTKGETL